MNTIRDSADAQGFELVGGFGTDAMPDFGGRHTPGTVFVMPVDRNERYVDAVEREKSLCTAFVTRNCLPDPYPFMHLVVRRFESAMEAFAKMHQVPAPLFVYKGGNLFLALYQAFIDKFPEIARKDLYDKFKQYFAYSDADFSIYYDPNVYSDDLHDALVDLVTVLQKQLRDEMLAHPDRYFAFFQWNDRNQRQRVSDLLRSLQEVSPPTEAVAFGDVTVSSRPPGAAMPRLVARSPDVMIRYLDPVAEDFIVFTPDYSGGDRMLFVQDNRALHFPRPGAQDIWFDLVRTKFAFATAVSSTAPGAKGSVVRLNGELLDVSITRQRKEMVKVWGQRKSLVASYKIQYSANTPPLRVQGLAYEYLIDDVIRILFDDQEYPWQDKKYLKRIHRLMFLLFMDTYLKTQNRLEVLTAVNGLLREFSRETFKSTAWKYFSTNLLFSTVAFQDVMQRIRRVGLSVVESGDAQNREAFKLFIRACLHDLGIFLGVFDDLSTYFDTNASVQVKNVYQRPYDF